MNGKRPMRRWSAIATILTLVPSLLASAEDAKDRARSERIGLYQVDLVCPAASLIGCGSAAKPILLQLERSTNVSEAWLNRAGTIIAVVWKESTAEKRAQFLASVLGERKVVEVKGEAREAAIREFVSGKNWYRGADVDRLSEEEAGIIAGRLVQRMGKYISLTEEKSKALQAGITIVMKKKLTSDNGEGQNRVEEQIAAVCRQQLSAGEIAILEKAREQGAFARLRDDEAQAK